MTKAAIESVENYAKKLEAGEVHAGPKAKERRWKSTARDCVRQVCVIYLVLKHPKSSRLAKLVAGVSVGYVFSPIQLIPSFIPVVGWLDDAAVLYAGMRLLTKITPAELMTECRANAVVMLDKIFPDKQAEIREPAE